MMPKVIVWDPYSSEGFVLKIIQLFNTKTNPTNYNCDYTTVGTNTQRQESGTVESL